MLFFSATYQKSQSAMFMLPEKRCPFSCRWCQDYAAGLEKSSTGEVPRLQKFCRHNYWVFAAPRKSKRQLTAESAECCWTQDASRRPSIEVPGRTATGDPGISLWTWRAHGWVANGVRVILMTKCLESCVNVWENRNAFSLDFKVDKVTQSRTVLGSEFQTAGAEQWKARLV